MTWITAFLCLCLSTIIRSQNDVRIPPSILKGPKQTHFIFRDDDEVVLDCKAHGVPSVTYEWKKDGFDLNLNVGNIQHIEDGSYRIKPATSLDQGYYQCIAKNQYGAAVTNTTFLQKARIDSYTGTPSVLQEVADFGKPFSIEAVPLRSTPKPTYSWEKALNVIDKTPEGLITSKRVQIAENGDLHFSYAIAEDNLGGRIYKCTTYNAVLDLKAGGSYTNVTVRKTTDQIPPNAPTLRFSSSPQTVALEGGEISLRCFFSGYPEPTIQWSGPNNKLPRDRIDIPSRMFDTELIIRNILKTDEGEYKCGALNNQGSIQHTLQLRVDAKPVFLTESDSPHNMNFTEGKTATINCNPYARPEANIVWLRNGEPLNPNNLPARFIISPDKKLLTIRDLCRDCTDRDDAGHSDLVTIQCNASNVHGYAFGAGYVNVLTATKVTILGEKEVRVDIDEDKRIEFQCTATSDPSAPPTVKWYKAGPNGDELLQDAPPSLTVKDGLLTIQVFPNGTRAWSKYEGTYKCVGLNNNSVAFETAKITLNQVYPPEPVPLLLGGLWWVLLLILLLILLIFLICIICCCLYRNRGDKYDVDNKERKNGNDPEKELTKNGFHDYQRPEGQNLRGSRGSLGSAGKLNSDDEASLLEFGDDPGKFTEDGSFVGAYANTIERGRGRRE